jgi:hypothetical protein
LANNAKETLEILHKYVKERDLIVLSTADNIKDTCLSGFSDNQLHVLKTCPILNLDQSCTPKTNEQRNIDHVQDLNSAKDFIEKMNDRAKNDCYHILVAGETNSGKSAFINGLLRRKILPSGKSSTSTFVEILDARDIGGSEEIRLCKKGTVYDCKNEHTFKQEDIKNLHNVMYTWYSKQYNDTYDAIKVYVNHSHAHANFFSNREHKARIIDSVGFNAGTNDTHFLFKKQQKTDVQIFVINAKTKITKPIKCIMRSFFREKKPTFVIITHLDCVCHCKGVCSKGCKERCKQKMMDVIKEISPETFKSADKLIHYVNPTLVWAKSGYVAKQLPQKWIDMEACLHQFIYDQFDFRKLSLIKDHLQKLMHDVILICQLNVTMLASKIDEVTKKILQLHDSIGQLEDGHDETYVKAKKEIDKTKDSISNYILKKMNYLKENPEKFVSREMINGIRSKKSNDALLELFEKKWKEFKEEYNRKIDKDIQKCKNCIRRLVKGPPKSSTSKSFIEVKSMLQDIDSVSYSRKPEKSFKHRVQKMAQQVLPGLNEASMQTQSDITHRTSIDNMDENSEIGLKMTVDNSEEMDEAHGMRLERR